MEEEMNGVSYLTLNGETREIIDSKSRDDISLLQTKVDYILEYLNIDISEITIE